MNIERRFKPGMRVIVCNDNFIVRKPQTYVPKLNQELTVKSTVFRLYKDGTGFREFLTFEEIGDYFVYDADHFRALDLEWAQTIIDELCAKNDGRNG